jgi:hypothetical protein
MLEARYKKVGPMAPFFLDMSRAFEPCQVNSMVVKKNQAEPSKALLALGSRVVKSLRESSPEALDLLDEYTESFDLWQRSWGVSGSSFSTQDKEMGRRIAAQHATVIELTEEMIRSVEKSLKELRGWSKGIRAYMDHFPKQVSTIRARKG